MPLINRLLPIFLFGAILALVIWQVEPPSSLTKASIIQLILFFVPLLLFLVSAWNLLCQFYLRSFILSLGTMLLITLKALDALTIISFFLTILATILIASSLKKPKNYYQPKIPKLSPLKKQK